MLWERKPDMFEHWNMFEHPEHVLWFEDPEHMFFGSPRASRGGCETHVHHPTWCSKNKEYVPGAQAKVRVPIVRTCLVSVRSQNVYINMNENETVGI